MNPSSQKPSVARAIVEADNKSHAMDEERNLQDAPNPMNIEHPPDMANPMDIERALSSGGNSSSSTSSQRSVRGPTSRSRSPAKPRSLSRSRTPRQIHFETNEVLSQPRSGRRKSVTSSPASLPMLLRPPLPRPSPTLPVPPAHNERKTRSPSASKKSKLSPSPRHGREYITQLIARANALAEKATNGTASAKRLADEAQALVTQAKKEEARRQFRIAALSAKIKQHWLRKRKNRDNETMVRNKYYQLMTNLIFDQPNPLESLMNAMQNITLLSNESSSDSVCFIGNIKPIPGAIPNGLKIFAKLTRFYDLNKEYRHIEPRIYKFVINPLIQTRMSPHFMMYLGSTHVDNWTDAFSHLKANRHATEIYQRFVHNLTGIDSSNTSGISRKRPFPAGRQGGDLLVTECGQGITLGTFLDSVYKKTSITDRQEFIKILFQVYYTLAVMDRAKVTHYDLHANNIFLERMVPNPKFPPQTFVYFVNPKTYVVMPLGSYFVRIFDWDFAFHDSVSTQEERKSRDSEICPMFGICNMHQPAYDMHKLFYVLRHYHKRGQLGTVFNDFIMAQYGHETDADPNKNLLSRDFYCARNEYCRPDALCKLRFSPSRKVYVCNGEWEQDPKSIRTADDVLTTFLMSFHNPSTFTLHDLPEFDMFYLPGTFKWINYVFGVDKEVLSKAKENIETLVKTKQLRHKLF